MTTQSKICMRKLRSVMSPSIVLTSSSSDLRPRSKKGIKKFKFCLSFLDIYNKKLYISRLWAQSIYSCVFSQMPCTLNVLQVFPQSLNWDMRRLLSPTTSSPDGQNRRCHTYKLKPYEANCDLGIWTMSIKFHWLSDRSYRGPYAYSKWEKVKLYSKYLKLLEVTT